MPKRTHVPDLTGPALNAHRIIQTESRLACLRFLLGVPSANRGEIKIATDLPMQTVVGAIEELEERGYITVNLPAGERAGRHTVRYQADRERVTTELVEFATWVLRPTAS